MPVSLGLNFRSIVIRVAEFLGTADYSGGAAAVPTDAHDLDLAKRIVNDGYRRFLGESDWHFLNPIHSLTLIADQATYDLPEGAYQVNMGPWTYPSEAGLPRINVCDEVVIRELEATGTSSGDPTLAAIRPKSVHATDFGTRWEVVFWPTPQSVYVIQTRLSIWPDQMTDLDYHRPIGGPQHDDAIVACAMAAADLTRNDRLGQLEAAAQMALKRSRDMDHRSVPRRLSPSSRFVRYTGVDTYEGVSIQDTE